MARKGPQPGDVVRYDPPEEPLFAAFAIFVLMLVELTFVGLFMWAIATGQNSVQAQKIEAFWFGSALLTLAAILSIYRRFFLPDVMIVKRRKRKYEDLM